MSDDRGLDRGAFRRIELGVLVAMVGSSLVVVTTDVAVAAAFPGWAPFTLPSFEMALALRPPVGASEAAMDRWLRDLWLAVWYGAALAVYYVALGATAVGGLLIMVGVTELRDWDSLIRRLR